MGAAPAPLSACPAAPTRADYLGIDFDPGETGHRLIPWFGAARSHFFNALHARWQRQSRRRRAGPDRPPRRQGHELMWSIQEAVTASW